MKKKTRKTQLAALTLLLAIAAVMVLALGQGAMELTPGEVLRILWGKWGGGAAALKGLRPNQIAVVWDIRLPRILCGLLIGMGLGAAGVVFQSLLRNPLADPYTLGVSSGAAFGASLAIYAQVTYGLLVPVAPSAFAFAFATLLAVILIARRGGGMLSSSLIVAGIILSAILSSGISLLKMLAGENVSAIVFWLMGSLAAVTWRDVLLLAPAVLLAGTAAYVLADELNVMTLGEEPARALGVDTRRTRLIYLVLGSWITAACVAVGGIIGFVGLVVPHILRRWLTSDNRVLLPLSALAGGFILLAADNATRLLSVSEVPVGVLTTLLGGPFFLYVFLRHPEGRGINA